MTMLWMPVAIGLLFAQDGPVPPQRVDPESMPVPAASEPVLPREGGQVQEGRPADQRAPGRRAPGARGWRDRQAPAGGLAGLRPGLRHGAASIFTDEAYRHARVRSLLEKALEGRF